MHRPQPCLEHLLVVPLGLVRLPSPSVGVPLLNPQDSPLIAAHVSVGSPRRWGTPWGLDFLPPLCPGVQSMQTAPQGSLCLDAVNEHNGASSPPCPQRRPPPSLLVPWMFPRLPSPGQQQGVVLCRGVGVPGVRSPSSGLPGPPSVPQSSCRVSGATSRAGLQGGRCGHPTAPWPWGREGAGAQPASQLARPRH